MSVLANSNAIESGGYNIDRSLRFRSSASAYLSRTPASAGNRQTWTWSGWVKRGALSTTTGMAYQQLFGACPASGSDATFTELVLNGNDTLQVGGWTTTWKVTTQVFRDTSAWYHFVWVLDTGNATAADRMRLYVNGSRITSFSTSNDPSLNATLGVNNNVAHALGSEQPYSSRYFDGYLAEVNFIDGQALTPSSFGETSTETGVWVHKKYTGTYGTNGFYLDFKDNTSATTLAYDKSGNGNNWTPNNISTTAGATYDSMTDVPTLTSVDASNFATINPVMTPQFAQTYYDGNLRCVGGYAYVNAQSTIAASSGKWYAEAVFTAKASSELSVGINNKAISNYIGNGGETGSCGYWTTGNKTINGTSTAYGATYTVNDVIGVAMDIDGGTVTFYKNGVSQGAISYTFSGSYGFLTGGGGAFAAGDTVVWNFGQRPFSYTPPTGFKALNTFNLPDPTIKKPNQYMDVRTWSGTTSFPYTPVTDLAFQPDFVWAKARSNTYDHVLYDSVRGTGTGASLASNNTNQEGFNANYANLSSFNPNGFTVQATSATNILAQTGQTFVGWQWKKGATPGFDIVTYTGNGTNATVAHSLGVAPKMIIIKNRNLSGGSAQPWIVYHTSIGNTGAVYLNLTNATATSALFWNNTSPTSSVFTLGSGDGVNYNTGTYVAYLFAEIPGFSKFGSYTGNGSADGPFVYCGFRPKYVMVKRTDSANSWAVVDTARDTYNATDKGLIPNTSDAEGTGYTLDYLSNGFKIRLTGTAYNASGGTYIYAAFAENPFKYSLAR